MTPQRRPRPNRDRAALHALTWPLLPAQLPGPAPAAPLGVRRLVAALLARAATDAACPRFASGVQRWVHAWDGVPAPFRWACAVLGVEPAALGPALLATARQAQTRRRCRGCTACQLAPTPARRRRRRRRARATPSAPGRAYATAGGAERPPPFADWPRGWACSPPAPPMATAEGLPRGDFRPCPSPAAAPRARP
jgi:hypothetical protein